MKERVEYGDFQTPIALAREVCELLRRTRVMPASILEPTCGTGSFLRAAIAAFPACQVALGVELDTERARVARQVPRARVECANFFETDWRAVLDRLPEPILVIGNPPWVTNSVLGSIGGSNLPEKSNFQRRAGLDAITGKSNFDISEWMLGHLLECLSGRRAVLAMLCKRAVARKVLKHAWSRRLELASSSMHAIDAAEHFGASVDACLLVGRLEPVRNSDACDDYPSLDARSPSSTIALRGDRLVADARAFDAFGHLAGSSALKWRSGIKHDCSKVMELRRVAAGRFMNGLGETVELETSHLYPMLKSSELANPRASPARYMLVPQRSVGEDTAAIEHAAPLTWQYLQTHAVRLDLRKSSIYRNRPRFSIFGVGPYSFAPWKVAISGLYKRLAFRCIGPLDDKPVVLDDTCYFLPCEDESQARALATALDSEAAHGFFRAFVFWDAKRPITAELLSSLDLEKLTRAAGRQTPTPAPVEAAAAPASCVPTFRP